MFFTSDASGYRLEGHTAAVGDGAAWSVHYAISLDSDWVTRRARIEGWSTSGYRERVFEGDAVGGWRVDGRATPEFEGCLDVDLESSACTNTFSVHRIRLGIGQEADAPAVYVRALDLSVERLPQRYLRLDDEGNTSRYAYAAPTFEFEASLVYDDAGLVLRYPGIAKRAL